MIYYFLLIFVFTCPNLSAYNLETHKQITENAFAYLSKSPFLRAKFFLIESNIGADYRPDLWFSILGHSFSGVDTVKMNMLTSLLHFTNARHPGVFWKYDGYAYANSDGTGKDSKLGIPLLLLNKNRSKALSYQKYKQHFIGKKSDWETLYAEKKQISKIIFPPSYAMAEYLYHIFLKHGLAPIDKDEIYPFELTFMSGLFSDRNLKLSYHHQEFAGLPIALEELGVVIHLAQDLGMPHHAQGIAGHCHIEYEEKMDALFEYTRISQIEL
ncbi:MAG: hypothetical protein WCK42_10445, partial [Myxococcaceae bacterium]